jgi:protein SCO1/2
MRRSSAPALAAAAAALAIACARPAARVFEMKGQVVAVDAGRMEITIRHEDIPNFMPGMTMPFKVRDRALLAGRVPGDLVKATLVVEETDAYLRTLERTGTAPLAEPPPAGAAAAPLTTGELVPDATFIDETGAQRRFSDWRGRVVAVTFIYTRCPLPNFCPLMDRHFRSVQAGLRADEALRDVRLLSITFDPAYDTPAVLAAHARRAGAEPAVWSFLTGDRAGIDRFAGRFGVSIVREEAGAQEIEHNLRTAVIDREGRVAAILRGNGWTPAELLAELRKAVEGR